MDDVQAEMIGSDVVIAGMVGEQCFAYSYYLTAKEQCNYEGGQVGFFSLFEAATQQTPGMIIQVISRYGFSLWP